MGPAAGTIFLVTVYPRAFVPTTVDIHSCVGNLRVTFQGSAFLLLLCLFGCHISFLLDKTYSYPAPLIYIEPKCLFVFLLNNLPSPYHFIMILPLFSSFFDVFAF